MVEHPAFNRVVPSSTLGRGTSNLINHRRSSNRQASRNPLVDADDRCRHRVSFSRLERRCLQSNLAARPTADPVAQIIQRRRIRTRWLPTEPRAGGVG